MIATRALKAHIWERQAEEHYVEPAWTSRRLFEEEKFKIGIYDPAQGFGTIPREATAAGLLANGCDIVNRTSFPGMITRNFLEEESTYPNIVTNPPFNIADKFALHALKLAERKVAIIFPVARLNAAHWLKGTPLRRVWLLTPRPSMPPGRVIAAGGKPGGGKMDYAWLVFEQGYTGSPELLWLRRDDTK